MDANHYQTEAQSTAIYPDGAALDYVLLGLGSEVGEVLSVAKKKIRDGAGPEEFRAAMRKELGDVLWYVAATASELGLELGDVMQGNLDKLRDRKERGALPGSGDER